MVTVTLRTCFNCGEWIETDYGKDSPAAHSDADGTEENPHAPGDYDNVCAPCNYNLGASGFPDSAG